MDTYSMATAAAALVFAAGAAFGQTAGGASSRTIHVAPAADGAATGVRDGSAERPFASLGEAQEALRRRMAAEGRGGWTVEIAAGEYPIEKPLTFVPGDSGEPGAPVAWRGPSAGGAATVSGARELKGWKVREDGRWEVDAPVVKARDSEKIVWFEQLYVGGRRAKRARHPNAGFLGVKSAKPIALPGGMQMMELEAENGALAPLAAYSPAELRFCQLGVHHKWSATRRQIMAFDAARGAVFTEGGTISKWNTWNGHSTCYVENAPFALDEPGEWLYDGARRKIVYIPLPGQTPENVRVQYPVPGLAVLLRIEGDPASGDFVHDIAFENIRFAFSDSPWPQPTGERRGGQAASGTLAAVLADGARRVELRGCAIFECGEYGLWLREGCVSNRVENCSITEAGAGGVRIGTPHATQRIGRGERITRLENAHGTGWNTVVDCEIAHGGRIHAEGVGVWIGSSPFNSVTHCDITDFYYTGVSIGWVWGYAGSMAQGNTLAFCRISDIGQGVLSDMGGVYTLGTSYGTCVSNNVICKVDSRSYGGWGLYPDEGSEGIVFENNLVYDTKDASFHQHYGKNNILRNNILAFSREGQIALTWAENHLSFAAERNIVYWDKGPVFTKYAATLKEDGKIDWKGNIWWQTSGEPSFNGKTFAQWQAKGNDRDGLVADPMFADPAKRDFRLKPDSPAVKAGFRPFDPGAAGRRCAPSAK